MNTSVSQAGASWRPDFADAMMRSQPVPMAMLVRGEGCWVWDETGSKYLDFLAGIAVNALGHAHPRLVEAVSAQVATLAHVSNYFATPPQLHLAERLKAITGAGERGRVFFANSGTEAIEAALKLARLNGRAGSAAGSTSGATPDGLASGARPRILSLRNSFHGRSTGALALTGQAALRAPFTPLVPGIEHIDSTIEALERAMGDDVAALIVEPIKGEAGVIDLPAGYLERARRLTEQAGALLILDEIQTGIGRTGDWFAYQHDGITPDAVALAKGLAGGIPIGALVTFGAASDLFGPGEHGSTFGGNPLACAAANAVLTEIEQAALVGNARRRGDQLRQAIAAIGSPLVCEVRGRGLLIGVGLGRPVAKQVTATALKLGLIVNAAGDDTIRLAPPLIVGDAEIEAFTDLFRRALAEHETSDRSLQPSETSQ